MILPTRYLSIPTFIYNFAYRVLVLSLEMLYHNISRSRPTRTVKRRKLVRKVYHNNNLKMAIVHAAEEINH